MSSDSFDKDFCLQKVQSAISLVQRLLDGDFPHRDSKKALEKILTVYESDRKLLRSLDSTAQPDTVLEHCRRANINLVRFKIFLGLLLRSSNLRNAFELYFPIKILATELLESNAAVVLSSEWNFSPFTYPIALPELPEFIFIGFPASESQNPLILPLAGHELGHVVWRRKGGKREFDPIIRERILQLYKDNWREFASLFNIRALTADRLETDLFLSRIWGQSYRIAQRQIEEVFCDFVGLRVFGRSFLHSFRYLLAPSLGQYRAVAYPKLQSRARYLTHLAKQYMLPEIPNYANSFSEQDPTLSPNDTFILRIADQTTEELYSLLFDLVEKYRGQSEKFDAGMAFEASAKQCLINLVPAGSVGSVTAIINAAWDIRLALDSWKIMKEEKKLERKRLEKLRILRDLVLKSLEVYEYQKRLNKKG
jgi:hypothetical protein